VAPPTPSPSDQAWLDVFDAAAGLIRESVAPLLGTEAGRAELGVGAGGDRTVELDRLAETAALDHLRAFAGAGHPCRVISEEAGAVDLGADYPLVMLDPVDGSLNAKQGLPVAAVMLSLADGPAIRDVRLGLVLNLATGECWSVVRGRGIRRGGAPVRPLPSRARPGRIGVLGTESSPRDLCRLQPLLDRAAKVRVLGSMALSLAHTAAGGIELFAAPMKARIFDMTAGVLMVTEVGGRVTDLEGRPLADAAVGLDSRTTLLASADPDLHQRALDALRG
jgi:myo-inositol-1(or 4)-monophosphatase